MLVTKEEAMKKWCPMARVAVSESHNELIDNRQFNSLTTTCMADECMMWEWESSQNYIQVCPKCKSIGVSRYQRVCSCYPDGGGNTKMDIIKKEELKGYCGLTKGK